MTRTKVIGFTAVTALVLGYGGMFATLGVAALGILSREVAVVVALTLALTLGLIGEAGLWVAAATLGWTIFAKRKALLDRLLRRKPAPTGTAV